MFCRLCSAYMPIGRAGVPATQVARSRRGAGEEEQDDALVDGDEWDMSDDGGGVLVVITCCKHDDAQSSEVTLACAQHKHTLLFQRASFCLVSLFM